MICSHSHLRTTPARLTPSGGPAVGSATSFFHFFGYLQANASEDGETASWRPKVVQLRYPGGRWVPCVNLLSQVCRQRIPCAKALGWLVSFSCTQGATGRCSYTSPWEAASGLPVAGPAPPSPHLIVCRTDFVGTGGMLMPDKRSFVALQVAVEWHHRRLVCCRPHCQARLTAAHYACSATHWCSTRPTQGLLPSRGRQGTRRGHTHRWGHPRP